MISHKKQTYFEKASIFNIKACMCNLKVTYKITKIEFNIGLRTWRLQYDPSFLPHTKVAQSKICESPNFTT